MARKKLRKLENNLVPNSDRGTEDKFKKDLMNSITPTKKGSDYFSRSGSFLNLPTEMEGREKKIMKLL